jgi:ankyrin repeat protein
MDAHWENAIKHGEFNTVLDLLEQGTDVNARDRYGQTALMLAAHAGHSQIVDVLIANQADLNISAKFGLNALMLALVAGHQDVAHYLAKSGADLSLRATGAGFSGKTAYDLAMELGMSELSAELKPTLNNQSQDEVRR